MILLACTITTGRSLDCRGVGGLDVAYVSDHVKGQVYGFTTGNIIGGTDNAAGSAMTFQTLEQSLESAQATETITGSDENGSVFYEQSVALKLFGNDDALRTLLMELSQGRFTIIAKDQRGQEKIYGKLNGLTMPEGVAGTGLALADLNGATITLSGKEPELANLVDLAGDGVGATIDEFVIVAAP